MFGRRHICCALKFIKLQKLFLRKKMYGLTIQMRKTSISIPSNIAEGYGRKSTKEYIQFLYIAYGSLCELETQILLSIDFGYIKTENSKSIQNDIIEADLMLKALIKSLKAKAGLK